MFRLLQVRFAGLLLMALVALQEAAAELEAAAAAGEEFAGNVVRSRPEMGSRTMTP